MLGVITYVLDLQTVRDALYVLTSLHPLCFTTESRPNPDGSVRIRMFARVIVIHSVDLVCSRVIVSWFVLHLYLIASCQSAQVIAIQLE